MSAREHPPIQASEADEVGHRGSVRLHKALHGSGSGTHRSVGHTGRLVAGYRPPQIPAGIASSPACGQREAGQEKKEAQRVDSKPTGPALIPVWAFWYCTDHCKHRDTETIMLALHTRMKMQNLLLQQHLNTITISKSNKQGLAYLILKDTFLIISY